MYRFIGTVRKGLGKAKKTGYPTANLEDILPTIELPDGVYAAKIKISPAELKDTPTHFGAVIIGARRSDPGLVEVYIFNLDDNIYGKQVLLEIHKKVSGIIKFEDTDDLVKKIAKDIKKIKYVFRNNLPHRKNNRIKKIAAGR